MPNHPVFHLDQNGMVFICPGTFTVQMVALCAGRNQWLRMICADSTNHAPSYYKAWRMVYYPGIFRHADIMLINVEVTQLKGMWGFGRQALPAKPPNTPKCVSPKMVSYRETDYSNPLL